MSRVIVDADVYAYSAGGATQSTVYDWLVTEDGEFVGSGVAESKQELEELQATLPEGARLETTESVLAEPLSNALALTKRSLLGVEEAMDAEGVEFDRLELFLTGKGNFREEVATIKGYKANRIGKVRPVHYKGIRRYMRDRWHATVVKGYEADDALAMVAHAHGYCTDRVVLVSQDKDLSTVPGRHYNPRKKTWTTVTKQEALLNFYRQTLVGDTADHIGGCFKCGPKAADELALCYFDQDEKTMAECVLGAYEHSLKKKGCPYTDAKEAMLENCRLLHMCRTVEETYLPSESSFSKMWNFPWERT